MKTVTPEELQQIENLKTILFTVLSTIGELHISKKMLEAEIETVNSKLEEQYAEFLKFQEKERVLFTQLQEKYKTDQINLDTGEILT